MEITKKIKRYENNILIEYRGPFRIIHQLSIIYYDFTKESGELSSRGYFNLKSDGPQQAVKDSTAFFTLNFPLNKNAPRGIEIPGYAVIAISNVDIFINNIIYKGEVD